MPIFQKSDIAKQQLQTGVDIFLRGLDYSSVITLAGAASGILDQLVKRAGKEPFVDYACRVHEGLIGNRPKRKSYAHHIDRKLGVIDHKHLAKDDPETVDLDLVKQAEDALARATFDYIALNGKDEVFIKAYLQRVCQRNKKGGDDEEVRVDPEKTQTKEITQVTYRRFNLAHNQLNAAISLFLSGRDRFSVITLAGAADVLLARLVLNTGQDNFTEVVLKKEIKRSCATLTRERLGKELNDTLFINSMKHMDKGDESVVEFDPEECAAAAIFKALANYVKLKEHDRGLVLAFRVGRMKLRDS
jgi:hypothetical protein